MCGSSGEKYGALQCSSVHVFTCVIRLKGYCIHCYFISIWGSSCLHLGEFMHVYVHKFIWSKNLKMLLDWPLQKQTINSILQTHLPKHVLRLCSIFKWYMRLINIVLMNKNTVCLFWIIYAKYWNKLNNSSTFNFWDAVYF